MLDERRGQRRPRRQRLAQRAHGCGPRVVGPLAERAPGGAPPFARIEPEADERRHEAAGGAALQVERGELAGIGIAHDEEDVEDAQRAAALDPLQGAEQPALELGARAEGVDHQLDPRRAGLVVVLHPHERSSGSRPAMRAPTLRARDRRGITRPG